MNAAELDTLLRQFLVDHKLSDHERDILKQWVQENISTEQQRGVARHRLFAVARETLHDAGASLVLGFVEDVMKILAPLAIGSYPASAPDEGFFSPGTACLERIVARLNGARQSVDICVFTITDNRIAKAILVAHKRGVKVRILTDNEKAEDRGSDIEELAEAGIRVRMDRTPCHMHHKFAIFDRTRLLNGSYNWTRRAADENAENLVDTGDLVLLKRFQKEFDDLWEKHA